MAAQQQLLWSTPWSNYTTVSSKVCTAPAEDVEAADDFDVTGTITRVVASGHGCFSCQAPVVSGATVRFYDWNAGAVGALQYEMFVPAGSPLLVFDPTGPETIDVTLPLAFAATGKHFVSVQLHMIGSGYWTIWVSNWASPTMSGVQVRDRLGPNTWGTPSLYPWPSAPVISDLSIALYGLPPGNTGDPAVACETWSPLITQAVAGATHGRLTDVKMFGVDDVFAVGQSSITVAGNSDSFTTVMHWDGHQYSVVPSPSPGTPGLINCYLDAVDGMSGADLWVAGTYQIQVAGGWVGQQVFAMHYDGSSWTVPNDLPLPNTSTGGGISGSNVADIKAIASDDVWFVGDWLDIQSAANPVTIRPGLLMQFDGSNLNQTLLPIVSGVGHQYFNAIDASGPNDVWVVGGAGTSSAPSSSVPIVFHYDGSSWTHQPCPTPPGTISLFDVETPAPNEVYVFGSARQTNPITITPFMARWDGSSWSLLPLPNGVRGAKMFAGNFGFAVGAKAWMWSGGQWTEQFDFTATADGALSGVDALLPCELVGVGSKFGTQIEPFAARQDNSQAWHTRTRWPLQPIRAPGHLTARSAVRPGSPLEVGIGDPAGLLVGANALTLWLVGTQPAPVGLTIPIGGLGSTLGEVLVDPASLGYWSTLVPLPVNGPAVHTVPLPNNPALVGLQLSSQGVLVDSVAPYEILFTNAVDMQVGW